MVDILKKEGNFIAIRMSDTIAPGDYKILVPMLEAMIGTYGKINLYCEIGDMEKTDPAALWEDMKFDVKHFNDFNNVVLVGDVRWLEWMVKFSEPFTAANVQCFMRNQKEAAMDWIESKTEHAY